MQETCSSGSVEGVMGNHDSYSDSSDGKMFMDHLSCPSSVLCGMPPRAFAYVVSVPAPCQLPRKSTATSPSNQLTPNNPIF
jgi:hypothetical protein